MPVEKFFKYFDLKHPKIATEPGGRWVASALVLKSMSPFTSQKCPFIPRIALLFSRITLLFCRNALFFPGVALLFPKSVLLFSRSAFLFLKNAPLFSRIVLEFSRSSLVLFPVRVFFYEFFFPADLTFSSSCCIADCLRQCRKLKV